MTTHQPLGSFSMNAALLGDVIQSDLYLFFKLCNMVNVEVAEVALLKLNNVDELHALGSCIEILNCFEDHLQNIATEVQFPLSCAKFIHHLVQHQHTSLNNLKFPEKDDRTVFNLMNSGASTQEIRTFTQHSKDVKDGDLILLGEDVLIMVDRQPVSAFNKTTGFRTLTPQESWTGLQGGKYYHAYQLAAKAIQAPDMGIVITKAKKPVWNAWA